MKVHLLGCLLFIVAFAATAGAKPLAFPGAAGFGRHAQGARGGSEEGVHDALFAYNRAEWYVQLVLATERSIVQTEASL